MICDLFERVCLSTSGFVAEVPRALQCGSVMPEFACKCAYYLACQTSKTRKCARHKIRTRRLALTFRKERAARATGSCRLNNVFISLLACIRTCSNQSPSRVSRAATSARSVRKHSWLGEIRTMQASKLINTLLSLHNPVARAARAGRALACEQASRTAREGLYWFSK